PDSHRADRTDLYAGERAPSPNHTAGHTRFSPSSAHPCIALSNLACDRYGLGRTAQFLRVSEAFERATTIPLRANMYFIREIRV
ncbi:MAG: hypothetical protein ACUVV0_14665, partial [Anaerolineae bacterium]